MAEEQQQATLRETIEQAFTEHVDETPPAPPAAAEAAPPADATPRAEDRPRDEQGRFVPTRAEKAAAEAAAAKPKVDDQLLQPPAVEPKPHPGRPSSWKKDYWEDWTKLDPRVAEYILQRESEAAKGVSTYKQEWDRAKPLIDVVDRHRPMLEQYGIEPSSQIDRYFQIHRSLALGSPQEKLGVFLQMAQQYQVPVEQLFQRGQDGQIYFNQQLAQQQQASAPQQQQPPVDVERIVETKLAQQAAIQQARDFIAAKDASGNPLHPHYETLRETMAQRLEAGLSDTIQSAYDGALRDPRHIDIFEAEQQQQRQQAEADRQAKLKAETERARHAAVSPRTSTPAGKTGSVKKGLRAQLEDAYDEHVESRV